MSRALRGGEHATLTFEPEARDLAQQLAEFTAADIEEACEVHWGTAQRWCRQWLADGLTEVARTETYGPGAPRRVFRWKGSL